MNELLQSRYVRIFRKAHDLIHPQPDFDSAKAILEAELARIGRGEYDSVWDRGDLTEYESLLRSVLDGIRCNRAETMGLVQKDEVAQQVELNVAKMIAERTGSRE